MAEIKRIDPGHPNDSTMDARLAFNFSPWQALPTIGSSAAREEPAAVGVGMAERIAATLLLVLLSPLLLLTGVAIKLDSSMGGVLYRQERVGVERRRHSRLSPEAGVDRRRIPAAGRPFQIYKFRTMIPDAEAVSGPVWASDRDPRITRVGQVLRYLRLDEIPQLINVIRGEMRLIGPRPERPHFVNKLSADIPDYPRRMAVPPGITGLAQVEREYDASIDDVRTKLKYDLFYVRNRCGLLDLKIILKTLDVMIRGRGAH